MKKYLIVSVMALAAFSVGCDDESSKAPAQPATPAPAQETRSIQTQAKDAAKEGKQAVQTAVTEVKAAGQAAYDQAKPVVQEAATQIKQGAIEAKQLVGEKVSELTGSTTTAAPAAESFDYQAKVGEALQYVKENRLDLADKSLSQVESRKASIPLSYHPKIESTRKLIESSKKAQSTGLALPRF